MSDDTAGVYDPQLNDALGDIVNARVDNGSCPTAFARVFRGADILFELGAGEVAPGGKRPGSDSVYRIASCSKSFTAATLLSLRDQGLVSLDARITEFIPEFTASPLGLQETAPTLRMLLSMSGGLATDDPWADRQESITGAQLREIVAGGVLLTTRPGTEFQYSNLGYALLGQVIEIVTGRPFREVARERIIDPLGLRATVYEASEVAAERLVPGFRRGPNGWVELPFSGPGAFSSIGGLFSCASDLSVWASWLASAVGDAPDPSGPLSVESRREMQQIATPILDLDSLGVSPGHRERRFGYGFGLFWEVDPRFGLLVSHSGGYPGFSSHMRWHAATGLGVVAFENGTYSGAAGTASDLIDRVLEVSGFELSPTRPWPTTLALARQADFLIHRWEDDLLAGIAEQNVALDVPFSERRADIERLVEAVGGLLDEGGADLEVLSGSALHVTWRVRGRAGDLVAEVRASPKDPPLIQTFTVRRA